MITRKKLRTIIVCGFLILVFLIFFGSRIFQTIKTNIMVGKKIIDLKNDISDLEEKNSNLKDFIANFKKEEYIEKEAKARLNLKNPGEKVIVIIEEEVKKTGDDLKGKSNALKDLWQSIKNTLDWWK